MYKLLSWSTGSQPGVSSRPPARFPWNWEIITFLEWYGLKEDDVIYIAPREGQEGLGLPTAVTAKQVEDLKDLQRRLRVKDHAAPRTPLSRLSE